MAFTRHKPYELTTHDGKRVDWRTKAMLLEMEDRLGYTLTVHQGSYNAGGVSASAGTHDGGGAVDLSSYDWENKVTVGRRVGFAMWRRETIPGLWNEHIHGIDKGNQRLSAGARDQVAQYEAGTDGLRGRAPDTFPVHPSTVFDYAEWQRRQSLLLRLRRLVRRREAAIVRRKAAQAEVVETTSAIDKIRDALRRPSS